jgi:hypothetical protein
MDRFRKIQTLQVTRVTLGTTQHMNTAKAM